MLVCHCHRVNDRTIRSAAQRGARTLDEVAASCGAGSGCGGCRPVVSRLLAREGAPVGAGPLGVRAREEGV
ncbi:MAG: bacterioferritin-associated ferredoxin [Sandaracinaceae bacterium]